MCCWQGLGGRGKAKGEVQAWFSHVRAQPQPQNRKAAPSSPRQVRQIRNVQDSGSDTTVQQARHGPRWAADSAPRKLGKSPQQGGRAISSLSGLLQAVPSLSSRSAGSWLYARLTPAAAQELAVRCPLGPPTVPPPRGIPVPLLTSVSLLFIRLFTGRAMAGKKKRKSWGHSSALRGDPIPS